MSFFKNSFLIVPFVLALSLISCEADEGPHGPPFFHLEPAQFDKCLTEAGLTKDELKASHDSEAKEPSPKQKCLMKCLATAAGFLDKDGTIVSDMFKKNAPSYMDDATVTTAIKCMEAAGKVATCDDMEKMMKCMPKPPKRPENK